MEPLEFLEYFRIFISNPENLIVMQNNWGFVKGYASVYTFQNTPDMLQLTAFTGSGCLL